MFNKILKFYSINPMNYKQYMEDINTVLHELCDYAKYRDWNNMFRLLNSNKC